MIGSMMIQAWAQMEGARTARIQMGMQRERYAFGNWAAQRAAGDALAVSHRQAAEARRQARVTASRALAVAAAGGGGVSDPTMVNILARVQGEGAYEAAVALYEGDARGRQMRMQAAMGAPIDQGQESAYKIGAAGTLAQGGMSLYSKYGMKGPGTLGSTPSGDAALLDAGTPSFSPTG